LYAESSAVLSWLLAEREASHVYPLIRSADIIVSSDLTLVECDRALIRATALGKLTETEAIDRSRELNTTIATWNMFRIGTEIVQRARRPFPGEPIRTLDAIHLASALAARAAMPDLQILTLDDRIRNAARDLGFSLQPR
jgi:predicted nucleic acid-binding protein